MRLFPEQLNTNLQQSLKPCYLVFGNEPLLKQEAIQTIITHAKSYDFTEIHRFSIDANLNWQEVYDACQALSLFASRQIIVLSLPETALNLSQTNNLKAIVPLLTPDILLILDGPRLNQKQEASQWFSGFNKSGVYVVCNTPEAKYMPMFIKKRCESLGLVADNESIQQLAVWHEGNLLALSQSLLKLQLLFSDGKITLPRVQDALSAHHHFTPFQLIDALIEGKAKRAIKILRQQEAEAQDKDLILLLRLIQKELILLYKMQERLHSGLPLGKVFDEFRIWQQKRPAQAQAINRLPIEILTNLLEQLAQIEVSVKTDYSSKPWQQLNQLCLGICGLSLSKIH